MLKTELLWLSAEEAAATFSYLKTLADASTAITTVVQSLFGRCCLATASQSLAGLDGLAEEAAALASHILNHPAPEKLGLDPLLLIQTHKMLTDAGKKVEVLNALHDRMALELMEQPPEARRIGRVRNIAAQLAALGYPVSVSTPGKDAASLLKTPERWFGASVAQLSDIAEHLVADNREIDEISTRILSLIALAELRNYRIDLACALLRAVFHVGGSCAEAIEALNFIALQRRRDGRYGFSNQLTESAIPTEDQHLNIYLPLTVNAVWLFRSLAQRRREYHLPLSPEVPLERTV